jgi:hypothetical protein
MKQYATILECNHCNNFLYVISDATRYGDGTTSINLSKTKDYYPKNNPKVDGSVPEKVARDFLEALVCFNVGAFKASVAMCRRALENSVIERGAKKGKLIEQINDLCDKQAITKDIKDWCHQIRIIGNMGAHPDEDGLEEVTQEDANDLINFMEEYLNYVYIMPAKVAEKRKMKKV